MAVEEGNLSGQWLFTEDEIQNTPSVHDGVTPADESVRRAKGVNFIIQAGILLKLPQMTLGTAAVFFHRFYMRYSMASEKGTGIHHYVGTSLPRSRLSQSQSKRKPLTYESHEQNIAATALFLASKAEETCRKTKEIVIAVAKVAQKNSSLIIDEQSKEFWRWKDSILQYEETMLELLTFDVVLESPYNFLYRFLKELDIEGNKPFRNVAWAFLNDSFMTTLCLLMPPKDIAVAGMYFSAKFNKEKLRDGENGEAWWVSINGVPERIFKAIDVMADFYTDNPLKKSDNPYDQSPENSIEDLERTRLRAESASPGSRLKSEMAEEEAERQDAHQNGTNGIAREGDLNGEAGDDDALLKAAANDPATHECTQNNHINGIALRSPNGTKRKDSPSDDIPDAKRTKMETDEESEEGEVEE